ncbi:GNAT family N-acetyltransferase [Tenggerimyces flavus]|uniref:GNAT family N-acetyltransferase n=1 Tax=Tenggerimyces flavus TaxID=1708749 RepID=A0ABV7Y706_9ACTN|nr:GNAT family N-acetyltransferase [Tenggerimyces flavus]MBM7785458.1 GNAT superfamily N-acetyltransferase [Tenggerimyces flavus]
MGARELIALEMETLWGSDARGRVLPAHHLVAGVTADAVVVRYGSSVPDELVARLGALTPDPTNIAPFLAQCQQLLDSRYGSTVLNSGPGYLIPEGLTYESDADFVDSRAPRSLPCPDTWPSDEWQELLAGNLGPWAVAVTDDDRVAAVAHMPASNERAAEIGIETHPDFRGRGLAAATTARWAEVAKGRTLFYSTSADNRSSQRVAERLGLEQLGWLWKLSHPDQSGTHAGRR